MDKFGKSKKLDSEHESEPNMEVSLKNENLTASLRARVNQASIELPNAADEKDDYEGETPLERRKNEFAGYIRAQASRKGFMEELAEETEGKGNLDGLVTFTVERAETRLAELIGDTSSIKLGQLIITSYGQWLAKAKAEYIEKVLADENPFTENVAEAIETNEHPLIGVIDEYVYSEKGNERIETLKRYTYNRKDNETRLEFLEFVDNEIHRHGAAYTAQYPDENYAKHPEITIKIIDGLIIKFAEIVNNDDGPEGLIADLVTYANTEERLEEIYSKLPNGKEGKEAFDFYIGRLEEEYSKRAEDVYEELCDDYSQERRDNWITGIYREWLDSFDQANQEIGEAVAASFVEEITAPEVLVEDVITELEVEIDLSHTPAALSDLNEESQVLAVAEPEAISKPAAQNKTKAATRKPRERTAKPLQSKSQTVLHTSTAPVESILEESTSSPNPLLEEMHGYVLARKHRVVEILSDTMGKDTDFEAFITHFDKRSKHHIAQLNFEHTEELEPDKKMIWFSKTLSAEIKQYCRVHVVFKGAADLEASIKDYSDKQSNFGTAKLLSNCGKRGDVDELNEFVKKTAKTGLANAVSAFLKSERTDWVKAQKEFAMNHYDKSLALYIANTNLGAGHNGLIEDLILYSQAFTPQVTTRLAEANPASPFDQNDFESFIKHSSAHSALRMHNELGMKYDQEKRDGWIVEQFEVVTSRYMASKSPYPSEYLVDRLMTFVRGSPSDGIIDQRSSIELQLSKECPGKGSYEEFLTFLQEQARERGEVFLYNNKAAVSAATLQQKEAVWLVETYAMSLARYIDIQNVETRSEDLLSRLRQFAVNANSLEDMAEDQLQFIYDASKSHAEDFYRSIAGEPVKGLREQERLWIRSRYATCVAEYDLLGDGYLPKEPETAEPIIIEKEVQSDSSSTKQPIDPEANDRLINELLTFALRKENQRKFELAAENFTIKTDVQSNASSPNPTFENFCDYLLRRAYPTCQDFIEQQERAAHRPGPKMYQDSVESWVGSQFFTGLKVFERCLSLGVDLETLTEHAAIITPKYVEGVKKRIDINFNLAAAGQVQGLSSPAAKALVFRSVFQGDDFLNGKTPEESAQTSFGKYQEIAYQARGVVGPFYHEDFAKRVFEGRFTFEEGVQTFLTHKETVNTELTEMDTILTPLQINEISHSAAAQFIIYADIPYSLAAENFAATNHEDKLELLGFHPFIINEAGQYCSLEQAMKIVDCYEMEFARPEQARYMRNVVISAVLEELTTSGDFQKKEDGEDDSIIEDKVIEIKERFNGVWGRSINFLPEPTAIVICQKSLWQPGGEKLLRAKEKYIELTQEARLILNNKFFIEHPKADLALVASIVEGASSLAAKAILFGEAQNVDEALRLKEVGDFLGGCYIDR